MSTKGDEHFRIYSIRPPRLDPESHFPATDCQHDDLAPLFFAPDNEGGEQRTQREHAARKVCAECPFFVECALHGLEHEDHGVWGGLSETDRLVLGGRGLTSQPGPKPGLDRIITRLRRAGVDTETVQTLLRRWSWRRREISKEAA